MPTDDRRDPGDPQSPRRNLPAILIGALLLLILLYVAARGCTEPADQDGPTSGDNVTANMPDGLPTDPATLGGQPASR